MNQVVEQKAPAGRRSTIIAFGAGVVACVALAASVASLGGAGAQAEPVTVEPAPNDELPQDFEDYDDTQFQAFDDCFTAELEKAGLDGDVFADPDLDHETFDFDAYDDAFSAADDACFDLLPEDIKAEAAEWEAYDQCIEEVDANDPLAGSIWIEGDDGPTVAQFTDTPGSLTISGTDGDTTVEATGGVQLLTDAEQDELFENFDDQFSACDDLMPVHIADPAFDD